MNRALEICHNTLQRKKDEKSKKNLARHIFAWPPFISTNIDLELELNANALWGVHKTDKHIHG